jgi:hypothetical protein
MAKVRCEQTNGGKIHLDAAADAEAKTASKNAVHEPFHRGPPEKESCEPMHQTQGIANHAFQNTRKKLRQIDVDNSSWIQTVTEVQKDAEKEAKPDAAFKGLTTKIKRLDGDTKMNAIMLQNAKDDSLRASQVASLKASIGRMRAEKKAIVDSPEFGIKADQCEVQRSWLRRPRVASQTGANCLVAKPSICALKLSQRMVLSVVSSTADCNHPTLIALIHSRKSKKSLP